jgi:hypothetical protein
MLKSKHEVPPNTYLDNPTQSNLILFQMNKKIELPMVYICPFSHYIHGVPIKKVWNHMCSLLLLAFKVLFSIGGDGGTKRVIVN